MRFNPPAQWRKAVYIATAICMVAALGFGFVTAEQLNAGIEGAVALLGAIAALLAAFNVSPDE